MSLYKEKAGQTVQRDQRIFSFVMVLLVLVLVGSLSAQAQSPTKESIVSRGVHFDELIFLEEVTKNFIQPKHKEFAYSVVNLGGNSKAFCTNKNGMTWATLKDSWSDAMKHWMSLHLVNYGPIDDSNLAWRFQFWPDPMNLVARKLKSRVKGRNTKISADELSQASVAIQGLSALEYLLFDESLLGEGTPFTPYSNHSHFCTLLQSTVKNLHSNAMRLEDSWYGEYPDRWLSKALQAGNPKYFMRNVEKIFSGMTMAIGASYRDRLGKALGLNKEGFIKDGVVTIVNKGELQLNPFLLESWRSRQSLENIKHTVASVKYLYLLPGGFSDILVSLKADEAMNLDIQIRKQIDRALSLLSDHKTTAYDAIQAGRTEKLFELYGILKNIHYDLKVRYTKLVGIQFRFNAHDGD